MSLIFVQTIWQVMEKLHDTTSPADALSDSLEILTRAIDGKDGILWILDKKNEKLVSIASTGEEDRTGLSIKKNEGILVEAISGRKTVVLNEIDGSSISIAGEDISYVDAESIICVPLTDSVHTFGCMTIAKEHGKFSDDDKKLCENICAILALDIEDKGFVFKPFEDRKPILSLRGVVKDYVNGTEMSRVLKGIDIDVFEGELMVILGESGCGKSTMLNIIGGMDKMTEGQLLVDGKDMSAPSEPELTQYRREYIGFIFQSYNLMPNLSALENVEFISEISSNSMDSLEALDMVGLSEKADHFPSALSGGQMQRVSIARALVKNPKIILADEPTAALDYETSIKILELIEKIVKERKTTVIMVTHNPEIAKMANRVVRLRSGQISSIKINLYPKKASELVW